jgi:hypothetical protein
MKNVETTFRMVTACVLTSVTLAAVIVALGAGSGDDGRAQANRPVTVEGVVSRVRIINFDDTIARFDSSTGAIAKYNGNLQNTSVRGTWKPHVEGVRNTSGLLEIQEAKGPAVRIGRCVWPNSQTMPRRGNEVGSGYGRYSGTPPQAKSTEARFAAASAATADAGQVTVVGRNSSGR